jgi:YgiT-type zinc finger domain-containing protein
MICHVCGGRLIKVSTDLPFKITQGSIIIIKDLPVLQCQNCQEYLIEDPIMEKIDHLLSHVDKTTELEILKFAV